VSGCLGVASLASSAPSVVTPSGNRLRALSAGDAAITARFAASSSAATPLPVSDGAVPVASIGLSVPLSQGTLSLTRGATATSTASIRYASGVRFPDARQLDWVDVAELLTFTSTEPAAVSVGPAGVLTLHANSPSRVAIDAASACGGETDPTYPTANVLLWANLSPGPADVDLGNLHGAQFVAAGDTLPVEVRIQVPDGERLVNFQVVVHLDPAVVSSRGGFYVDAGGFAGVESTLNDPPSEFQLAASNSASTASGLVVVGTVHLAVQAPGAAPVTGEIIELITVVLATGARRSYGGVDLVAGQGVAVARAGTGRRLPDRPFVAEPSDGSGAGVGRPGHRRDTPWPRRGR